MKLTKIIDQEVINRVFPKSLRFDSIESLMKFWNVENWSIKEDEKGLLFEINQSIKIIGIRNFLPIRFSAIYGNFNVSKCFLTGFENFPSYIGGNLNCSNNDLKSFKNFPKVVMGNIDLSFNKNLIILDIKQNEIFGDIDVSFCNISNIKSFPKQIEGSFIATGNQLKTFQLETNIEGDLNLNNNKLISNEITAKFKGLLDISNNPCTADKIDAIWT